MACHFSTKLAAGGPFKDLVTFDLDRSIRLQPEICFQ